MNKKICFITSLFSKKPDLVDKPSKFKRNKEYDYFIFTNLKPKIFNTSWDIVQTNFNVDDNNHLIFNFKSNKPIKENDIKENEIKENEIKENEIKENEIKENKIKENEIKENEIKENNEIEKKFRNNVIKSRYPVMV